MTDGFVLLYKKDEVLYPVVLTKEQETMFGWIINELPGPIRVVENHPIIAE